MRAHRVSMRAPESPAQLDFSNWYYVGSVTSRPKSRSEASVTENCGSCCQRQEYQPRAIGLDIVRDHPVELGHQELTAVFEKSKNLFVVEKG